MVRFRSVRLAIMLLAACSGGRGSADHSTPSLLDGQTELGGPLPPLVRVTYASESGDTLIAEYAYEGLVSLFVRTMDKEVVRRDVADLGGEIVDAIPLAGMYVARVAPDREADLIEGARALDFVILAVPSTPFTTAEAKLVVMDFLEPDPDVEGDCEPHGAHVLAVAERGGRTVRGVEVATPEFRSAMTPIPGLPLVVGNWPPALARALVRQMEDGAKSGDRVVINLSLQSVASGIADRRGSARGLCDNPSTAGALECMVIQQEQLSFLSTLFQEVERSSPEVRHNTTIVVAAGNAGVDLTRQVQKLRDEYPEAAKSIRFGGATDADGLPDTGMNYASEGITFARGEGVPTLPGRTCDGTSFASPQIARILADMWDAVPSLTSDELLAAFDDALANCDGAAVQGNVVPPDDDGSPSPQFVSCAVGKARQRAGEPADGGADAGHADDAGSDAGHASDGGADADHANDGGGVDSGPQAVCLSGSMTCPGSGTCCNDLHCSSADGICEYSAGQACWGVSVGGGTSCCNTDGGTASDGMIPVGNYCPFEISAYCASDFDCNLGYTCDGYHNCNWVCTTAGGSPASTEHPCCTGLALSATGTCGLPLGHFCVYDGECESNRCVSGATMATCQ